MINLLEKDVLQATDMPLKGNFFTKIARGRNGTANLVSLLYDKPSVTKDGKTKGLYPLVDASQQALNRPDTFDKIHFLLSMKKQASIKLRRAIMPIIPVRTLSARIRRNLQAHLRALGFTKNKDGSLLPPSDTKEVFRRIHQQHRLQRLKENAAFIEPSWNKFQKYFANGVDIDPEKIEASLELVKSDSWQGELFRLASLTWSVPVSNGYGRRMRFLVWDKHNGKLMGLMALADPVYNLSARDKAVGWSIKNRSNRLICMMDAYVLGALPPYNQLLCGKLVACLVKTKEVRNLFRKKYANSKGIISKKKKSPRLVAVTTSSSLGRSSVYNRLKLDKVPYLEAIGYTSGFGHFQVPQCLFVNMREFLVSQKHSYANGTRYGTGPNWRLRTIRACLIALKMNENVLKHNLKREVFLSRLAENVDAFLQERHSRPNYAGLKTCAEVSKLGRDRWIIPRAATRPEFRLWLNKDILRLIAEGSIPKAGVVDEQ